MEYNGSANGRTASARASKWQEMTAQILAAISIQQEYELMGVKMGGRAANAKGWKECFAFGREHEQNTPSACINLKTGWYKDSAAHDSRGETMSLWDFAVRYGGHADWKAARKYFAEKAGISGGRGRPPADPEDLVDWTEWNDALAQMWCFKKPGVTVESLKLAGCRMGRYPKKTGKYAVLAMPVYGPRLVEDQPISFVIWNLAPGGTLEVHPKKGGPPRPVKMKTLEGTSAGLMNYHGLFRLVPGNRELVVFKVEGPTDAAALQALIPADQRDKYIVVTNSGGSTQGIPTNIAHLFGSMTVFVLHDADRPGEVGAAKWILALKGVAESVKQIRLPYPIEEKRGKDLRDWIAEGHTFDDLLVMAKDAGEYTPPPGASGELGPAPANSDPRDPAWLSATAEEEALCRLLQIDVLGEIDHDKAKVFSEYHKKTAIIPSVSRLTYVNLLQIGGQPIKVHVNPGLEEIPDLHPVSKVREAIARLAGQRVIGAETEIGVGCWRGQLPDGSDYPSVVLVGAGEACEFNGAKILARISHPRCRGHVLDLSSGSHWYDHATLAKYLELAGDPAWCFQTTLEAHNLFARWRWKQKESPLVMAGLVLATWVQTLWDWRPQVAIPGPTQSGKSTLFDTLKGIFGPLGVKSSLSSAAGIRQHVKTTGRVIICDEFEDSRYRRDIMEMLRTSGRGDVTLRGTAGAQRGTGFGLRHIVWVAAIEIGLRREPDRNRFIMLELMKAEKQNQGKLSVPPLAELSDLGQRMLAVAIRNIDRAKEIASWLKNNCRVDGVDGRILECYSVPAAMLSAVKGNTNAESFGLLQEILRIVENEGAPISDEHDLVESILAAQIPVANRGIMSISQLTDLVLGAGSGSDAEIAETALARVGIKFDVYSDKESTALCGQRAIVVAYKVVSEHLLKGTQWKEQSIEQILKRLPEATMSRRRVGGHLCRVIMIPLKGFRETFLVKDEPGQNAANAADGF